MRFTGFVNEGSDQHPFEVVETVYQKCLPFIKEYLKYFRPELRDDMLWSGHHSKVVMAEKKIRKDRHPKDMDEHMHERLDDEFLRSFGARFRSNAIFCTGDMKQADGYGSNLYGIFPIGNSYSYCWSDSISDLYQTIDEDHMDVDVETLMDQYIDQGEFYEEAREIVIERFYEDNTVEDFYEDLDEDDYEDEDEYQEAYDEMVDKAQQDFDDALDAYADDEVGEVEEEMARNRAEEVVDEAEGSFDDIMSSYTTDHLDDAINSNHEIMLSGDKYMMIRHDYCMYILRYMKEYKTIKPTKETFAKAMKGLDPKRFPKAKRDKSNSRHFTKYINKDLMSILGDPL